jgi:homocitrate synthase NifV
VTTFSAEDGARTDPTFLREYVAAGAAAGADRFRLAETVSSLQAKDVSEIIGSVARAVPGIEVEMHSHNMLGLAVANALAAAEAGAHWISATVGGLGERGGNTPLAEVLTCMWRFWGDDRYNLSPLTELTRQVAQRSGVEPGATAGSTAPSAYQYEIAGQWRYPEIFEAVPPELVGNTRGVRVRARLRSALLRACFDEEQFAEVDVDAVVEEILTRRMPPGKEALGLSELRAAMFAAAARIQERELA